MKIKGPREAKEGENVMLTCTTENSNPPANITWGLGGYKYKVLNSTTTTAPHGGSITSSTISFDVRDTNDKTVIVNCYAVNPKVASNAQGMHVVKIIC